MINSSFTRLAMPTLEACRDIPASILADVAGRRGALHGRIRAITRAPRLCGTAFTIEVRPGDNLMIHAALVLARPGDVLVIDGKADLSAALMGELMCTHAQAASLAGVVIDGAVRDVGTLRESAFPVYACGTSPNGPNRSQGGRIGYPVSVGGVAVNPGDLVVGDDDGVVVIPQSEVAALLPAAHKKMQTEAQRMKDIQEGRLIYGWLEGALKATGDLPADQTLLFLMDQFKGGTGVK